MKMFYYGDKIIISHDDKMKRNWKSFGTKKERILEMLKSVKNFNTAFCSDGFFTSWNEDLIFATTDVRIQKILEVCYMNSRFFFQR